MRRFAQGAVFTVVVSEFVALNPWEWLLHSQTALRLKLSLLFRPSTVVIDVPYHVRDAHGPSAGLMCSNTGLP